MLEEDRSKQKKAAEDQKEKEQKMQAEEKIKAQQEIPKEKPPPGKIFPKSPLFKDWGENLPEDDQREAQSLFEKYGYNVFLSDRLPLDRALPDTRDPRYNWSFQFSQPHPVQF